MIGPRHPAELLVEWGAATFLALGTGFFVAVGVGEMDRQLVVAAAIGTALVAGVGALALLRAVGSPVWRSADFDVSPIDGLVTATPTQNEELLLTDAIHAPDEESRVVRLFAPETMHVPGDLAGRIDEWLDGARARLRDRDEPRGGHGPAASPASAALHTALADIRRSLG